MAEQTGPRARINVSVSTKGVMTYDVTGEATGTICDEEVAAIIRNATNIVAGCIDAVRKLAKDKTLVIADDYAKE